MQFLRTLSEMYPVQNRKAGYVTPVFETRKIGFNQLRVTNKPLKTVKEGAPNFWCTFSKKEKGEALSSHRSGCHGAAGTGEVKHICESVTVALPM